MKVGRNGEFCYTYRTVEDGRRAVFATPPSLREKFVEYIDTQSYSVVCRRWRDALSSESEEPDPGSGIVGTIGRICECRGNALSLHV